MKELVPYGFYDTLVIMLLTEAIDRAILDMFHAKIKEMPRRGHEDCMDYYTPKMDMWETMVRSSMQTPRFYEPKKHW